MASAVWKCINNRRVLFLGIVLYVRIIHVIFVILTVVHLMFLYVCSIWHVLYPLLYHLFGRLYAVFTICIISHSYLLTFGSVLSISLN
jgi:hypothetical protein